MFSFFPSETSQRAVGILTISLQFILAIVIAGSLLASPALAQLTYTAGPPVAPLGSNIQITVSNDGAVAQPAGLCFYVSNGAEIPVFNPLCVDLPVMLAARDFIAGSVATE